MPRPCSICTDDRLSEIDEAIASGRSLRDVAKTFGFKKDQVFRHKRAHLPVARLHLLTEAHATAEAGRALSLLERVKKLVERVERLAETAEKDGHAALLLQATKELRETYRLEGSLSGELDERPTVNVLNLTTTPEWLALRTGLLRALRRHPEALEDVRTLFRELKA